MQSIPKSNYIHSERNLSQLFPIYEEASNSESLKAAAALGLLKALLQISICETSPSINNRDKSIHFLVRLEALCLNIFAIDAS